ncbi:hypothetical protein ANCCAN_16318 [Ancylostoma caninum]|uniref:Uncharacterized protein n=1 Tax=Ancylostoma caninum TaxID=29170 RepID=A0A368G556_ANCCA|nr:hypothetical protein ANCCAN_16318 [Ancylostoma caninum]
MVAVSFIVDMTINAITLVSTILYIHIEIVLYILMRRGEKERMSTYFFLVFYCGFVNILVIFNQVFFRLLPNLLWQQFFYSLGSAGSRTTFMMSFGSEMFVILCEGFIAISRYLTFAHPDSNRNYWNLKRIRHYLIGIFLNLVIRIMNFLSFAVGGYDVIPISVFVILTKIGIAYGEGFGFYGIGLWHTVDTARSISSD